MLVICCEPIFQCIIGRQQANDCQHDKADTFLSVIGAVGKGHAGTGKNEQVAHPPDRWFIALRGFIQMRVVNEHTEQLKQKERQTEAEQWRQQQRTQDAPDLVPVDAILQPSPMCQRGLDCDADERSDQRMRTRVWNSQPPGPDIPSQCRREQRC